MSVSASSLFIIKAAAPQLFGALHLTAGVISVAAAVITAYVISGHIRNSSDGRSLDRVLMITGFILLALEVFKQIYILINVSGGRYDFWYFPFQLCSVPMYLCVLIPLTRGRLRDAILCFLSSYTLIGALAALIIPEDFLRRQAPLTAHGFIWHGLLLFISLVIIMSNRFSGARGSAIDFVRATVLYACMCLIAVLINCACEPYMQAYIGEHSYAAMFYLNLYHLSPQPLVDAVQKSLGIPAGLALYALVTAAASGCELFLITLIKSRDSYHIAQ